MMAFYLSVARSSSFYLRHATHAHVCCVVHACLITAGERDNVPIPNIRNDGGEEWNGVWSALSIAHF